MDKKRLVQNAELVLDIVYILSFIFIVAALLCSTNYAMKDEPIGPHYICLGVGLLVYLCGHILQALTNKRKKVAGQLFILDIILALLSLLLMIRGHSDLKEIGREGYMISFSGIAVTCIWGIMIYLRGESKKIIINGARELFVSLYKKKYLLILLSIISIIFIMQSGSEPRWDGSYVFHYLHDLRLATVFNMRGLQFCDHISMTFIGLNKVLQICFGDLALGMTVATYLLLIGSIGCVYGIVKELLVEKTDLEYTCLTAVYAFSPFIVGLSGYNYWDYWVITLFPVVIYTAMKSKWVYHFLTAIILCFTKETAVISYGAYCAGRVLKDFIETKTTLHIVKQRENWGMLLVGLTWLYFYTVLPNWNGVGGFSIDGEYILNKLKVLYVLNFNWILCIGVLATLIWLIGTKSQILLEMLPILISDIAFVLFSCLFDTVNHARYINTHIISLNLVAIVGIGIIKSRKIKYICNSVIITLMIISNYKTVDPLTLQIFRQFDIGNDIMISTCTGEYLSDSMVYNQQYRYFDGALNLALEEAVYDEQGVHLFPTLIDRSWFFEGISTKAEVDELEIQYWDEKAKKRVLLETRDSVSFPLYNINEKSSISALIGEQIGYYYAIPFMGTEIMQKIEQDMKVLDKEVFEYRGWEVTRLKFVVK